MPRSLVPQRQFTAALEEAAALAALSPSSHNCQPWALARLTGAARTAAAERLGETAADDREYLVLALDERRRLGALAAHAVEMELSCGAYWHLLTRALAALGWETTRTATVQQSPAPGPGPDWPSWPDGWTPLCLAELRPSPAASGGTDGGTDSETPGETPDELAALARARRTNRGPYRDEPLDPELLGELAGHAESAALPGTPVDVHHVTEPDRRAALASYVARHAGRDFKDRDAWAETHSFIRRSDDEAERRGDGFTLAQLFGPLSRPRRAAMRLLLDPRVMRTLSLVGVHRALALGLSSLVRRSPALVVMSFRTDSPDLAGTLGGGAAMAHYWLAATRAGLSLHPVSVLLQHDDLRERLERRLGLDGRAFFLARVGSAQALAQESVRRSNSMRFQTVGTCGTDF